MQFHIDDMTCGGCASTVKKTILTLDANAAVRTDPATRLVDVENVAIRGADCRRPAKGRFPAARKVIVNGDRSGDRPVAIR
ncbi:Heavy-metal-associated domain-containing protein [Salmonella enterica subsp. enterica]|uniref:Heavy-metal-associated domain-containing protein n=1 Tax=Salmonella enterica I TaxID=59201 RepID=A0A447MX39_SALET|nr:Heavy-metal-associated domain-containing protein [Salmonella enterica subsp. enterica]